MARSFNPFWSGWKGSSGSFRKQIVYRTRGGKTYVSKYPDMSNVVPSPEQLKQKSRFSRAVEFAKIIIADPVLKANYKTPKGRSVYHTAISDYLEKHPS